MMPSDQVGQYSAWRAKLLFSINRPGGRVVYPPRRRFNMGFSVIAGGTANIVLEGGTIFAKIVPQTSHVCPIATSKWHGKACSQSGHCTQMLFQSMLGPLIIG